MATVHRSYRLDEGLLARLSDYADAHNMRNSEAVSYLLLVALDAEDAQDLEGVSKAVEDVPRPETRPSVTEGVIDALKASNADLRAALVDSRATISTLTAQLSVKDGQISQAHELASQAQRLQMADVARASLSSGGRVTLRDRIKSIFGM